VPPARPRAVVRLVHPEDPVIAEISVRAGRVLVHEVSAFDPLGLVTGCAEVEVTRTRWRPLAELLTDLGYFPRATIDGLEGDIAAAESLDDVPVGTRKLIEILATVFDALEAADAVPEEHDA